MVRNDSEIPGAVVTLGWKVSAGVGANLLTFGYPLNMDIGTDGLRVP